MSNMAEVGSIYSAIYSGTPVFEMIANDIAVMRRRTDSYMNATQILKVAKIDKGKRTKILEKEVLIGEHEKVQGGYGKYQGTWIPFEKSKELAVKYGVYDQLAPMFDFNLDNMANQAGEESLLTKEQAMVARKKQALEAINQQAQMQFKTEGEPSRKKLKAHYTTEYIPHTQLPQIPANHKTEGDLNEQSKNVLMSIYLSDNPEQAFELLSASQGENLNLDMVIDEQGNTALHWATSLARKNTLNLLVSKGANVRCKNYAGETPLMKAVMVTNSFENDCFPSILDLLKESIPIVDNKQRSVLHYTAITAGIQGRLPASIYYMKTLLQHIQQHVDMKSLVNSQDSSGDTCLNIAARLDCQPLVDILLEAGALPTTNNNNGLQMNDYNDIQMGESSRTQQVSSLYSKRAYMPSQRGKEIVSTVQKIVDALDEEYGAQLSFKEQEIQKIQLELDNVMKELKSTRKGLEEKQAQSQKLSEAQQLTRNIALALQQGYDELKEIMSRSGKEIPSMDDISKLDENEDIDVLFNMSDVDISLDATDEENQEQMDLYVKRIQAKVRAYTENNMLLEKEIKTLDNQYTEKEMQCKRLIAACCNLPIEKIDELVEPLTLAIESDPPDLDLARVIGFMDKIRRQGAFTESANNLPHSPQPE